ncbi:hypothetical protein EJ071_05770 [Mesorhizobium sp. M1B.F.Ca.ET.045.04.1.1]|nr:hypothetical protein EJ071_05770 [Mesorhizobium sp. M1B.F.Ca.ET.045.04.1.1]TIS46454.1 MAG: hypothetical protein E5W96_27180 [Mesorhizobium sp.]
MVTAATPFAFATLTKLDKRNLPRPAAIADGFTRPGGEWEPDVALAQWLSGRRDILSVVILGRSKERSDAAQTLGSMPLRQSAAAVQVLLDTSTQVTGASFQALRSSADVTAWILGSSPRMTKARHLTVQPFPHPPPLSPRR